VEEDRAIGRATLRQRQGATNKELRRSLIDVLTGMLFSNVVMYFVILTTAATLHHSGQTNITGLDPISLTG
jgi:Mn2+/Fe2+ NRAMP family transporter